MRDVEFSGRRRMTSSPSHPSYTDPPQEMGLVGEEIDLGQFIGILRRRALTILLVAVLCAGMAVGVSFLQTPVYESSIQMVVGQRGESEAASSLGSDIQGLQQFTQTAAELAGSRTIAEGVIENQGLSITPEQFLENLSVEQATETQVIEISYQSEDPQQARDVANAVGEVFSERVSEVSSSANDITATVWQQAALADQPISPDPVRGGALAFVLGLMLGVAVAFVLEYLDDSWHSSEEAEAISGAPTFGMIREFKSINKDRGEGRDEPATKKV